MIPIPLPSWKAQEIDCWKIDRNESTDQYFLPTV